MLTRAQIEKLAEIIRKHASWAVWKFAGDKYVDPADLDRLKKEGLIPTDVQPSAIEHAFVLGRMESLLKEAEWKNFSWDQLLEATTSRHTELQQAQIAAAQFSASITLRGLFEDIQQGLYRDLARSTGKAVTEAVVKDRVAEEIKSGVEQRKNYIKVANGLIGSIKETKRNWHRVASTELHAAKEKGFVTEILSGEGIYRRADGPDSLVAVTPDPDACTDCNRLYLDPSTGYPKIFKLSELLANEGTNYARPWREHARPVVPPLHPHCFCRVRYVPPGWGWNDEGRFTVVDSDRYMGHLKANIDKSIDILKKAAPEDHELLNSAQKDLPTTQEIDAAQSPDEVLKMAEHIKKLRDLYNDDPDKYREAMQLYYYAHAKAVDLMDQETSDAAV